MNFKKKRVHTNLPCVFRCRTANLETMKRFGGNDIFWKKIYNNYWKTEYDCSKRTTFVIRKNIRLFQ